MSDDEDRYERQRRYHRLVWAMNRESAIFYQTVMGKKQKQKQKKKRLDVSFIILVIILILLSTAIITGIIWHAVI